MIYLNHAGTTWPRPPEVLDAVARAGSAPPDEWPTLLEESRAEVAAFLGIADPERLLFAAGCTAALAVALSDLPWRPGAAVITSGLEHHALARPVLKLVRERGVVHDVAPYAPGEPVDLAWVEARLRRGGVHLVAVTSASNVTGERLPVEELVALAHTHGALCLVDAAQTAGLLPLDAGALGVDLLAFAGHKGPQGPQGIGGLYVAPGVALESPAASCELRAGGAAACSPLPGYCDVGSVNLPGAAGLAAGVRVLRAAGAEAAGSRARELAQGFLDGAAALPGVRVLGGRDASRRTAAVSITLDGHAPADLERWLLERHGIATRAGHHCAPLAHETLGTAREGTLRVSFGGSNGVGDVETILSALGERARLPPSGGVVA